MPAALQIVPLADRPEAIPLVAGWMAEAFSLPEPHPPEYFARMLRGNLQRDRLPLTYLALHAGECVGTASLDLTDLPSHDHRCSPWLASVYVPAAARGQGIAWALIRQILDFARGKNLPRVYLWTVQSVAYYEKRGWKRLEAAECGGRAIQIMVWEFAPGLNGATT